jgi:hypothetical protein
MTMLSSYMILRGSKSIHVSKIPHICFSQFVQNLNLIQNIGTAYVRGDGIENVIEWVQFELHPTFQPSIIKVSKPPYEITRTGWGIFEIGIKVNNIPSIMDG